MQCLSNSIVVCEQIWFGWRIMLNNYSDAIMSFLKFYFFFIHLSQCILLYSVAADYTLPLNFNQFLTFHKPELALSLAPKCQRCTVNIIILKCLKRYYSIYNTILNTSLALGDSGNMQTYLIQIDVQLKFRILLVLFISDSFFTCWSMEYICQMTKHFYGNIFRNGFCTKLHK